MRVHRLWPVLLTLVLGCDAGERQPSALESERIAQAERAREAECQDALDAERAAARLELLAFDLDRFDQDISRAVTMVADAMTPSQRDAAKARLRALQVEQANLKRRIAEARADHEKARRHSRSRAVRRFRATRGACRARTDVTRFDRIWEPLSVVVAFCVLWLGTLL